MIGRDVSSSCLIHPTLIPVAVVSLAISISISIAMGRCRRWAKMGIGVGRRWEEGEVTGIVLGEQGDPIAKVERLEYSEYEW